MKNKLTSKQVKKLLKEKTFMFTTWNCEYLGRYMHHNFYLPIKELFKEVILWDPKKRFIKYGSTEMKRRLIEAVGENKPDYILFTVWGCGDFESIDLVEKFREVSPNSKIVGFYADDDRDFEISSRFYAPFIDYNIVVQPNFTHKYIEEGNKAYSFYVIDTKNYAPSKLEKKYDVSFIGTPNHSRLEVMKLLMKNGVKLNIWGNGWLEYLEFRDICHDEVYGKEFNKIICQTKVNLGFTKNQEGLPHFKARVLENAALKAFTLVDYFKGYLDFFEENKEIVMFKDNDELIKKINYYIKHDKKREDVAEKAYKKTIERLDIMERLVKIFKEILEEEDDFKPKQPPKIDKKIIKITKDKMNLSNEELKSLVNKCDYVTFGTNEIEENKLKEYFQIYSLEKTKKDISLCSYYIGSSGLGNIMRFRPFHAFKNLEREKFNGLLNINAVMVSKNYFLENMEKFKSGFNGKIIDFIDDKNTIFIDLPLFRTDKINNEINSTINTLGAGAFSKAFQPNFVLKIYSRMHNKNLLNDSYVYKLVFNSFFKGNTAVLKYLYSSYFNKSNWDKLKKL